MKKSTKRSMKIVSVVLALVMVLGCSLAYFTDFADTSASGQAGTVDIQLDASGINLLDADGKNILNPGDSRCVDFAVNNLGNKSVDVRTTITLTSSVPMVTDENGQAQFELYVMGDVELIDGEGAKPVAGAVPLEIRSISADGKTITYNIPDYILNGIPAGKTFMGIPVGSADYEIEDDALQHNQISGIDPGINGVSQTAVYNYRLVFRGDSSNDYQNATVTLNVLVEAKQHRNTEAGWELVAEQGTIVPGNDNVSYSGDLVMDAQGRPNEYFRENALIGTIGMNQGETGIYGVYVMKDKSYVFEVVTMEGSSDGALVATEVPTTSYTINGNEVSVAFTFKGRSYELDGNNYNAGISPSDLSHLYVDGVLMHEDTTNNGGNGGNNGGESNSSDFELYNDMIKQQGYSIAFVDGSSYEVVYKVTESDGLYFIDVQLYDNKAECFASGMWSDKSDKAYFSINFGNVTFEYADGSTTATLNGSNPGQGGSTPSDDTEEYERLLNEGATEVYNDGKYAIVAYVDYDKEAMCVCTFEVGDQIIKSMEDWTDVSSGSGEIESKFGYVVYDNGDILLK